MNVSGVNAGDIDGTTIPIVDWRFVDADTIKVVFKLSGTDGVSGSGYITKIDFEVTGSEGDSSVLNISAGVLMLNNTGATEMPAIWIDDEVTIIGIGVPVIVNAPEYVSGAFEVTIDIRNVADMNGGQFDLSFDPSVVNVIGVTAGNIDGTAIPILAWRFVDADTIRVLFMLSDAKGVSGSGYVTKIDFEVTGSEGDSSVLDISAGLLSNTGATEIPAIWIDDEVTIGEHTSPAQKGDLNHDNQITPADAAIALQLAATGAQNPAADVNDDGRITSIDALMILKAAAGGIIL